MFKKRIKKITNHKKPLGAYRYHIDNVNEKVISGWAHKKGKGNYTANIEIQSNNIILFSTKANLAREDLKDAGIGTGLYGFSIDPEKIKLEHDINAIDIFIDGHKANTKPIPLTLNKNINVNIHQMHVDEVSVDKIIGWAKKEDSISHRSLVELRVGDIVIGSGTADIFRKDIKDAGIGDGCYCFEITPIHHLFPSASIRCDLYIDEKKVSTVPIELSLTEQAFESAKFSEKFSVELSTFGGSVTQELQRLTDEVNSQNDNAVNVAIGNIALLSVRVEVIERILTKHFSTK